MDSLKDGDKLEVRIEPWLFNVIYVFSSGKWRAWIGGDAKQYGRKTSKEVDLALRREKQVAGQLASRDSITVRVMKQRERFLHPQSYDKRITVQQEEMAHLFRKLGMYVAMPDELLAAGLLAGPAPSEPIPAPGTETPLLEASPASVVAEVPLGTQVMDDGFRLHSDSQIEVLYEQDGIFDAAGYN
jgi:hypothetical protein